jgi:hypothetical protein
MRARVALGWVRRTFSFGFVTLIRTAAQEVRHLDQLERAGESEWTPWIAIAGLILFYVALGLVMFGIVETALHLLASASPKG